MGHLLDRSCTDCSAVVLREILTDGNKSVIKYVFALVEDSEMVYRFRFLGIAFVLQDTVSVANNVADFYRYRKSAEMPRSLEPNAQL